MNVEEMKERLRKLKALADRGEGGERDVAEQLLNELATKYNISLDFINEESIQQFTVRVNRSWQRKLLGQLLGLMRVREYGSAKADKLRLFFDRFDHRNVYTEATQAQWLEIMAQYEVLKHDYQAQLNDFYLAFLMKNDLLIMADDGDDKPSREELEKHRRAAILSLGVTRSKLNKQLEVK